MSSSDETPRFAPLLLRYPARLRPLLQPYAAASPAYCDLLHAYPAAAVAIAQPRRCSRRREQALALTSAGAPLRTIGDALGLPPWLRRLPPEAMTRLPARFGEASCEADFGRQVLNAVPGRLHQGGSWLATVLTARRRGGDAFALWLARNLSAGVRLPPAALGALAAFAFYSEHPELEAARYLPLRFHARMSLNSAGSAAHEWLLAILLLLKACSAPTCFAHTLESGGLTFTPLETLAELRAEGRRMRNCLGAYGLNVLSGRARVYSVRRLGVPVATLEVRPGLPERRPPCRSQLKGPLNTAVSPLLAIHVAAWFARAHEAPSFWREPGVTIDPELWRALWAPYVAAHTAPRVFAGAPPANICARLLAPLSPFVQSRS